MRMTICPYCGGELEPYAEDVTDERHDLWCDYCAIGFVKPEIVAEEASVCEAPTDPWPDRCPDCGAGDDNHHSFTCPSGLHPDRKHASLCETGEE